MQCYRIYYNQYIQFEVAIHECSVLSVYKIFMRTEPTLCQASVYMQMVHYI